MKFTRRGASAQTHSAHMHAQGHTATAPMVLTSMFPSILCNHSLRYSSLSDSSHSPLNAAFFLHWGNVYVVCLVTFPVFALFLFCVYFLSICTLLLSIFSPFHSICHLFHKHKEGGKKTKREKRKKDITEISKVVN